MSKFYGKEYQPAKIEPCKLTPLKHLRKHNVNQTIDKVNQLVLALFKQKTKIEEREMISLLKYFSV
jgi:hypothetical protein